MELAWGTELFHAWRYNGIPDTVFGFERLRNEKENSNHGCQNPLYSFMLECVGVLKITDVVAELAVSSFGVELSDKWYRNINNTHEF
jgi:hypothetical protein